MQSIHFEFLRPTRPELAELGAFAEHYAYADPPSALMKLRLFGENMVADLYHHYRLQKQCPFPFLVQKAFRGEL